MDADEQLENIVRHKRRFKQTDAVKLRDIADRVVTGKARMQKRYGKVLEVWSQLLSGTLLEHCWIVDIKGGVLKVQVDSAAYRQELEWCRTDLLRQIRRRCGRFRIDKPSHEPASKEFRTQTPNLQKSLNRP